MKVAIIVLVIIGILDAFLVIMCAKMERKGANEVSRYVDIGKVLEELYLNHNDIVYIDKKACAERIKKIPSIDIVRCQDCKHWVYNFNGCARNPCTEPWYATDFCNYGERKE